MRREIRVKEAGVKALVRGGIAAAMAAGLTVLPLETSAQPISCNGGSVTVSISEWSESEGILCGDKLFEFVDTDLNLTTLDDDVTVQQITPDVYAINFAFDPDLGNGSSAFLDWSVTVQDPNERITAVDVDSTQNADITGGLVIVAKTLTDAGGNPVGAGTITSTNGVPDTTSGFLTPVLNVHETFDVTGAGTVLFGAQNTIFQTSVEVPLPATLMLLGAGLLSASLYRRRNR